MERRTLFARLGAAVSALVVSRREAAAETPAIVHDDREQIISRLTRTVREAKSVAIDGHCGFRRNDPTAADEFYTYTPTGGRSYTIHLDGGAAGDAPGLVLNFGPGALKAHEDAAYRYWNATVRVNGVKVRPWVYVNTASGLVITLAETSTGERYADPNTRQPAYAVHRGVVTVEDTGGETADAVIRDIARIEKEERFARFERAMADAQQQLTRFGGSTRNINRALADLRDGMNLERG